MTDDKIEIRDRRGGNWFYVHNAVYDLGLSCEAMTLYCSIARYANNHTEKSYFSGKKFKAHHKIGHAKLKAAMDELISHKLISATGSKTQVGASYFELLEVGWVFQGRTGGCSDAEQGGVSPQNTNKTEKTRQENETEPDSLPLTPRTFEQKKPTKSKPKSVADQECNHILSIMSEHDKSFNKTQEIIKLVSRSIKDNGFEETTNAVRGRLMVKRGRDKSWRWLFTGNTDYLDALAAYKKEDAADEEMQKRWTINTDAPADFSDLENKLNSI